MPPLVVHGFRNGGGGPLRYLNFHAPGRRFADYLRATRDGRSFEYDQFPPPADGVRPRSDAVVGGEEVAADGDGLRVVLLADVEEIAIAETRSEPGADAGPSHVHHRHAESFYVLEGELAFTAGGRDLRAPKGSWVQVPPGVSHSFAAVGSGPARFLDVHTPSCGFGALDQAPA